MLILIIVLTVNY